MGGKHKLHCPVLKRGRTVDSRSFSGSGSGTALAISEPVHNPYRSVILVLVAILANACSGPAATPTSASSASGSTALTSDQLAGRWLLSSVQPAGQAAQIAPAGVSYDLTFADGRASVHADCNSCGGTLTVSGQTLTIGPALACTRAACPTMAFENLYESILGGASDAALSGSVLTLSSTRGVLRFTR